jgi:phosphoribosylaminoimidazole carboxylase
MLKSRKGGYDGRGNAVLRDLSEASIASALKSLGVPHNNNTAPLDLYAEGWVQFHSEIAVIVVRSTSGETRAYPAVTAVQTDSICRLVISPARNLSSKTRTLCEEMASRAIDSLGKGATGVFGVELFVVVDDQSGESNVLLNEVAPRPHNTGHYTQDACAVSQFENHLRAICGLPLGSTSMSVGAAASEFDSTPP